MPISSRTTPLPRQHTLRSRFCRWSAPAAATASGWRECGRIQRACADCGAIRYIDRDGVSDGWDEALGAGAAPEPYECPECGSAEAHVCLGFAGYANHPGCKEKGAPIPDAVLWYYVGVRCCACRLDGLFGDGKVGRGPMEEKVFREIAGEATA